MTERHQNSRKSEGGSDVYFSAERFMLLDTSTIVEYNYSTIVEEGGMRDERQKD